MHEAWLGSEQRDRGKSRFPVPPSPALPIIGAAVSAIADNPLLQSWDTPFGLPPFDRIAPEHFPPAFDHAISEHEAEIAAIAAAPQAPDFANTIEALERSGRLLTRIGRVFDNLTSSATNDDARRDRPRLCAAPRRAPYAHLARCEAVRAGRCALPGARPARAGTRPGAPARTLSPALCASRGAARSGAEDAHGGNR